MCAGWVGGRRRRRRIGHWWRRRRSLRAVGHTCLHLFHRRATGARGCGRAFGRRHLPPRRRSRLAGGLRGGHLSGGHLRGGGACVQRRPRRHKESSRRGGRVAGVARVCRVGRRKGEWSREGSVRCRRMRPSPELHRRPRGGEDSAVGRRGAGGSFSAGLFRGCLARCRALEPKPKF
jgi:hypothetical protein